MILAPETINSLVSTATAAQMAGVKAATIRKWVERGHLKPATDEDGVPVLRGGRPLYKWIDVAKAERLTRDLARRTFVA